MGRIGERTTPRSSPISPRGGGRESNPPSAVKRCTGFEVRGQSCCRVLSDPPPCHLVLSCNVSCCPGSLQRVCEQGSGERGLVSVAFDWSGPESDRLIRWDFLRIGQRRA